MARVRTELTATERTVLAACRDWTAAVAAVPEPDPAAYWAHLAWQELRTYGPRYRPAQWFGGGEPLPERVRMRFRRAVARLTERGLLESWTGEGGRLENVKLTPAGVKALAALTAK